jgi:hypothetical protein
MLYGINFKLKTVHKTKYFGRPLTTIEVKETLVTLVTKAIIVRAGILVSFGKKK